MNDQNNQKNPLLCTARRDLAIASAGRGRYRDAYTVRLHRTGQAACREVREPGCSLSGKAYDSRTHEGGGPCKWTMSPGQRSGARSCALQQLVCCATTRSRTMPCNRPRSGSLNDIPLQRLRSNTVKPPVVRWGPIAGRA